MLAIEVEYLLGRSFAAEFSDETEPEWPPHPDRLFQAMVAAYHDFEFVEERVALEWLESLGSPAIAAGEPGVISKTVAYVRTNYDGKLSKSPIPSQRDPQPRSFPAHAPSTPLVYFIWTQAQPDTQIRERLSALLDRVPSLGRACSFVRARLADNIAPPNWLPDNCGQRSLRIFGEGRLVELETLYKIGRRPSLGAQARYATSKPSEPEPAGTFGEMIVLRRIDGRPLPIEAALTLTTATRRALMSRADADGDHPLCELLSGHGDHPHCAITALPFAGHEHADGRLMGVAVVLPTGVSAADRRKLVRLCAGIESINLKDSDAFWKVELSGFDLPRVALNPATWMRASTTWASVTPVLLDRFPKRARPAEDILSLACQRIGLPAPVEIEHGPYSDVSGVSPVPAFRIRRKKDENPRWGVHVKLRFATPVRGPLLIGAGRFFGLGLLKPWTSPARKETSPNDSQ